MKDDLTELFRILSNERIRMILKDIDGLKTKKEKVTRPKLRKSDETTESARKLVGVHVKRLLELKMIDENNREGVLLTTFGELVVSQIRNYEFLINNSNYFGVHSGADLPPNLMLSIGSLNQGKTIKNHLKIYQKLVDICKNAKKDTTIYSIKPQVPPDLIEEANKAIKRNIKYKYVLPEKVIVVDEKDRMRRLKEINWSELLRNGTVEKRKIRNTPICLIVNQTEACIAFPKKDCIADLEYAFYSKDKEFRHWCKAYFNYIWQQSKPSFNLK